MPRWRDVSEALQEVETDRVSALGLEVIFALPEPRTATDQERYEALAAEETEKREKLNEQKRESRRRAVARQRGSTGA